MNRRLIFLIGARGSGKTTVARLLAERMGWAWRDADMLLEERAGKTIRQIFMEEGEAGFRERESALLEEIAGWTDHVIATGGGAVLSADNRELLRQSVAVWLCAAPHVLWQRMQGDDTTAERRPDLAQGGPSEVHDVLHAREPLYRACAELHVETDQRSPAEVVEAILEWLRGQTK